MLEKGEDTASVQLNAEMTLVTLGLDEFSEYIGPRDEYDD